MSARKEVNHLMAEKKATKRRRPEVDFEGARCPSLSAAGKAAAGYPVNGWRFWRPVDEPPAE